MLATFGAGCFWGVELEFSKVKGVITTVVGYMGGDLDMPDYQAVCTGTTGHAEVLQLDYEPSEVSYDELLELFWRIHNPTTLNRQGPDVGTQYRSVIFYHNTEQALAARKSVSDLNNSKHFGAEVITEIAEASEFYKAEGYHQCYLKKQGG